MRFERSDSFRADYRRLKDHEKVMFRDAVRRMNDAYEHRGDHSLPAWSTSLRIKEVKGAQGILEMTWSFSGPDGRATFEIIDMTGEPGVRWRRIGGHRIFQEP